MLQLSKATNPTSVRAAYVELFLSIKRKTSCQSQYDFTKEVFKNFKTYGCTREVNGASYCLRDGLISSFMEEAGHDLPDELKEDALSHCTSIHSSDEVNKVVELLDDMQLPIGQGRRR